MNGRDNPFAPPRPDSSVKSPKRGSPVVAVLAGVAADIGGTFLAVILVGIVIAATLGLQGMSQEQIGEVFEQVHPASWESILGYIVGLAFSVLGGYVCARVAGHSEYKLAAIVAAIGAVLGLMGSGQMSPGLDLLLTFLSVACVMAGAWLGAARNRVRAARSS